MNTSITKKFHILIIIFTLFLFLSPSVDTKSFETSSESEKVLELENTETQSDNDLNEKNKFLFTSVLTFLHTSLTACRKPIFKFYIHSYTHNSSLYKPPILFS